MNPDCAHIRLEFSPPDSPPSQSYPFARLRHFNKHPVPFCFSIVDLFSEKEDPVQNRKRRNGQERRQDPTPIGKLDLLITIRYIEPEEEQKVQGMDEDICDLTHLFGSGSLSSGRSVLERRNPYVNIISRNA